MLAIHPFNQLIEFFFPRFLPVMNPLYFLLSFISTRTINQRIQFGWIGDWFLVYFNIPSHMSLWTKKSFTIIIIIIITSASYQMVLFDNRNLFCHRSRNLINRSQYLRLFSLIQCISGLKFCSSHIFNYEQRILYRKIRNRRKRDRIEQRRYSEKREKRNEKERNKSW